MNERGNCPERLDNFCYKSRISDLVVGEKPLGVIPFELEILHCRIGALVPFRRPDQCT